MVYFNIAPSLSISILLPSREVKTGLAHMFGYIVTSRKKKSTPRIETVIREVDDFSKR